MTTDDRRVVEALAEIERLRAELVATRAAKEAEWERCAKYLDRAERAEAERDALAAETERLRSQREVLIADVEFARKERDAYAHAMAQMNAPAIAVAAMRPPPPIIMPAQDWELHQTIQTLNERIAYLEPIVIAARNLVDNADEYECDGLGLWAQHGWWEPLHDALDPDGSEAADDIRQPVAPAK